jgi:hypothetical protein
MQLRTYTGLWNVEKRLYKFYDISLPYPVSVKQLGLLIGSAVPWLIFMKTLNSLTGFASGPSWTVLWIAPPIAVMIYANRPIAEGKTLTTFLSSQIKFYLSPRVFTALRPEKHKPQSKTFVDGKAWRRLDS